MRCLLVLAVLSALGTSRVWGTSFSFDLTEMVSDSLATPFPEVEVDLGIGFSQIISAGFSLVGTFHPGQMRAVGPEHNTNPLIPTDTVVVSVRIGEIGTAILAKELIISGSLVGQDGNVQLYFPLWEVEDDGFPEPNILNPSVVPESNYDSLLDGKFGLFSGTGHLVASLYQVIEYPRLEVTQFTLQIEGAAIPEPASQSMLAIIAAFSLLVRSNRCS